jgi:hypothetical protein
MFLDKNARLSARICCRFQYSISFISAIDVTKTGKPSDNTQSRRRTLNLLYLLDRVQYELPDSAQAASMASGHLCDLEGYLRKNAAGIINYRERRCSGRRISTSAIEGTVNRLIGRRMCKSQQMCWTKRGAHLLLQVRCAVFNGDLLAGFQRWFPTVGIRRIMLPWDWLPQQ